MNPQDELLDLIDTYLNKGMSEEERIAFEEKIAQDETLADKVNEVRITNEAIYYASLAELKNTIGKNIKNIKYDEPTFNWKKASYISIASLALLSGVTAYLVTINSKDELSKPNTTESIEKIKQYTTQEDPVSATHQNVIDTNDLHPKHVSEKEATKQSTHIDNTPTQKSILPADNSVQHVEQTKTADSENKPQSSIPDATVKKIATPDADSKIICDKTFKIHTEASCKQKETGSISITSDGAYSYTFHLDIRSTSGTKGSFSNISAGVYEIMVTYGKECAYTKKVTVPEKWCTLNDAYSFNPDYNEKWIPIYENGASGTFTIFDKSGKDIYSNTFGSGNEEWVGNDRQGVTVPVGVYIAFINYSDGRKEKVELTIVR